MRQPSWMILPVAVAAAAALTGAIDAGPSLTTAFHVVGGSSTAHT